MEVIIQTLAHHYDIDFSLVCTLVCVCTFGLRNSSLTVLVGWLVAEIRKAQCS
jgi:hypothetical protein